MKTVDFPSKNEYPAYAHMYMKRCKRDVNLQQQLLESLETTKNLVKNFSEELLNYSYEKNKWTIKELLVHIIDDERIYAYRALVFARNDHTLLPGFEQDNYVLNSYTKERSIQNILKEYEAVRMATIFMYNGFSKTALNRTGIADSNKASVRALGYHILGHELHHINVLKKTYMTRYKTT